MNEENVVVFTSFILFSMIFLYLICKIVKRILELFGSILALLAVISVWYLLVQIVRSGTFDLYNIANPITYEYLFNFSEIVSNRDYYSSIHESTQKLSGSAHNIANIYSLISIAKSRWEDLYSNE